MYFWFFIQTHAYVIQYLLSCHQDSYCQYDTDRYHHNQVNILICFLFIAYFHIFLKEDFIHYLFNNSIFYCCLLNFLMFVGSRPWSLVGLILACLEPKSPKTLHSSDECPGKWMRYVCLGLSFGWYTYLFLRFLALSLISELVFEEAASPLIFLLWPERVTYSLVGFLSEGSTAP